VVGRLLIPQDRIPPDLLLILPGSHLILSDLALAQVWATITAMPGLALLGVSLAMRVAGCASATVTLAAATAIVADSVDGIRFILITVIILTDSTTRTTAGIWARGISVRMIRLMPMRANILPLHLVKMMDCSAMFKP